MTSLLARLLGTRRNRALASAAAVATALIVILGARLSSGAEGRRVEVAVPALSSAAPVRAAAPASDVAAPPETPESAAGELPAGSVPNVPSADPEAALDADADAAAPDAAPAAPAATAPPKSKPLEHIRGKNANEKVPKPARRKRPGKDDPAPEKPAPEGDHDGKRRAPSGAAFQ